MADDDDDFRRSEELDALRAFYGDDLLDTAVERQSEDDGGGETRPLPSQSSSPPNGGPWRIRVGPRSIIEMILPPRYPSSDCAPTPLLHVPFLSDEASSDLKEELLSLYCPGEEVAILWAERCRDALEEIRGDEVDGCDAAECDGDGDGDGPERGVKKKGAVTAAAPVEEEGEERRRTVLTFVPPTSRFRQPTRSFSESVVLDDTNRRLVIRGDPYHPPRSGPSETFVAHVASVGSMDHVNWVLADLLFNDTRVRGASHNMFAYRFFEDADEGRGGQGRLVADCDDDGEKGSGAKLSSLLELTDVRGAIVLVSRRYGGKLLGPNRFKYIASTARRTLEVAGFIAGSKKGAGGAEKGGDDGGEGENGGGRRRGARKGLRR